MYLNLSYDLVVFSHRSLRTCEIHIVMSIMSQFFYADPFGHFLKGNIIGSEWTLEVGMLFW